jgi:hypothetical protein
VTSLKPKSGSSRTLRKEGSKELGRQGSAEGVVQGNVGEGVGVRAEDNGNRGAGADREQWRSGMNGNKEWDAFTREIIGIIVEKHGKVAMQPTAARGGN